MFNFWNDSDGVVAEKVAAFNADLAANKKNQHLKLVFQPNQTNESKSSHQHYLIVPSARKYRFFWIISAIVFIFTVIPFAAFLVYGAGINAIGGVQPLYTFSILLLPTSLIFGLPSYILSKRHLILLKYKLIVIYKIFGKSIIITNYPYRNLLYIKIGTLTRADTDCTNRKDWSIILTFAHSKSYTRPIRFCEFDYKDLENKISFWLNNLIWKEVQTSVNAKKSAPEYYNSGIFK